MTPANRQTLRRLRQYRPKPIVFPSSLPRTVRLRLAWQRNANYDAWLQSIANEAFDGEDVPRLKTIIGRLRDYETKQAH